MSLKFDKDEIKEYVQFIAVFAMIITSAILGFIEGYLAIYIILIITSSISILCLIIYVALWYIVYFNKEAMKHIDISKYLGIDKNNKRPVLNRVKRINFIQQQSNNKFYVDQGGAF